MDVQRDADLFVAPLLRHIYCPYLSVNIPELQYSVLKLLCGWTERPGAHCPHVTWAHVMLRVRLGCERRFNIEFYGADSPFCHSAYVTWSHVELWSAHVPARLLTSRELMWCYACGWDVRGDLALNSMAQIHTSVTLLTSRDVTWNRGRFTCQHASEITWRKQSDISVNLRHRIQC